MPKIIFLLTFTFGIIVGASFAQKPTTVKKVNSFSVNTETYFAKINVYRTTKVKIKKDENLMYYWYFANAVHISQGDVGGMVLHGPYTAYYNNENLKEKGEFNKGLKDSKWVSWYDNGRINEIFYFKDGIQVKNYYKYSPQGVLLVKAHYCNNKLNGKYYQYDSNGNLLKKTTYKNGNEKIKKQPSKPGLFKRLFLKKDKQEKKDSVQADEKNPDISMKNNTEKKEQKKSNVKPGDKEKKLSTKDKKKENNFFKKVKSWFKKEDESKKTPQ